MVNDCDHISENNTKNNIGRKKTKTVLFWQNNAGIKHKNCIIIKIVNIE